MSRIGKLPIPVPGGVSVTIAGDSITVKGPKGQLSQAIVDGVSIAQDGDNLIVTRESDHREHRARHGLMRALVNNMVIGVSKGFEKKLEIIGVGYKAELKGKAIDFYLGHSHSILHTPPEGVTLSVEKGKTLVVSVSGIDKAVVGQQAAVIRGYRPPDSYKGKGVRYQGEYVRLKAGKSAKAG